MKAMTWSNAEDMLTDLAEQLSHIARQVRDLADNPRAEYDDLLQEARIEAWQAYQYAQKNNIRDVRQYILGAARKRCERYVWRISQDPLYHAENWGLLIEETAPDDDGSGEEHPLPRCLSADG